MRRQFNETLDALPTPGFVFLPHPPVPPFPPSTPTVLTAWGPPSVDTAGYFSPMAPSDITIPLGFGGPHLVSFFTIWDPGTPVTDRVLTLNLGGSPLRVDERNSPAPPGPMEHGMTWHVDLADLDVLTMEVEHIDVGPVGLGAGAFWSVQKLL